MNRAHARGAALATLAGALLAAHPASAYVRYKTKDGLVFFWPSSCVPVTLYANDLTDLDPAETLHATQAAALTWSSTSNACTYMLVDVQPSTAATPNAGFDYHNVVVFRRSSWCKAGETAANCTYPQAALAITSVFVSTKTGEIRDADVEVNAKFFVWTDYDLDMTAGKQDLQNALTHEFGHLLGLDHTCFEPLSNMTRPFDNAGQPVPDCNSAPEDVRATTMFASAMPGDISKRTLAPDDQQAVCDIYPAAMDPGVCPPPGPPETSACACGVGAKARASGVSTLAAAALAVMLAGRRRRRAVLRK